MNINKRIKRQWIGLGVVLQVCLLAACISDGDDGPAKMINYVEVGDVIPSFKIIEEDGTTLASMDFTGKTSVLVFFHTGCSDCQREIPVIQEVWDVLKNESDCMLAMIARGQTIKETDVYWEKQGLTLPRYHDPERKVFELFANSYVPRLYIIDRQGTIRWMAIETFNMSSADILEKVRMLHKDV